MTEKANITKEYIRKKLETLNIIFAKASIGDFSQDVLLPEEEDEFSELYAGVQIMQEVIREKIDELQHLNRSLEDMVEQRTRQLAEKEELYRTVVEGINDGLMITDMEDRILFVNSRMAEMSGFSVEELMGKIAYQMLLPANEWPFLLERIGQRKQGVIENYEMQLWRKDGTQWWVEVRASPMYGGANKITGTVGAITDITNRKEAEQEQKRLLSDLERSNKELSNFAYIVSHDLKAPLRGISFLCDALLSDYSSKIDSQGQEYLHLMVSRAERMKNLIEGILQYSRVGLKADIRREVDLNEIVTHLVTFISPPPHITISIDTPLPHVIGEPTQLSQVFQNLIDNSVKYNDKPHGEIHITASEDKENWIITIADNGPGIEPQYHEEIFKIFQTLEPARGSTGIGLSIVKKIIEFHGGTITVSSEKGQGAAFTFTLPKSSSLKPAVRSKTDAAS